MRTCLISDNIPTVNAIYLASRCKSICNKKQVHTNCVEGLLAVLWKRGNCSSRRNAAEMKMRITFNEPCPTTSKALHLLPKIREISFSFDNGTQYILRKDPVVVPAQPESNGDRLPSKPGGKPVTLKTRARESAPELSLVKT